MKSLGIAIKKGEIWYSFIEGTDRNVAIISEPENKITDQNQIR